MAEARTVEARMVEARTVVVAVAVVHGATPGGEDILNWLERLLGKLF